MEQFRLSNQVHPIQQLVADDLNLKWWVHKMLLTDFERDRYNDSCEREKGLKAWWDANSSYSDATWSVKSLMRFTIDGSMLETVVLDKLMS